MSSARRSRTGWAPGRPRLLPGRDCNKRLCCRKASKQMDVVIQAYQGLGASLATLPFQQANGRGSLIKRTYQNPRSGTAGGAGISPRMPAEVCAVVQNRLARAAAPHSVKRRGRLKRRFRLRSSRISGPSSTSKRVIFGRSWWRLPWREPLPTARVGVTVSRNVKGRSTATGRRRPPGAAREHLLGLIRR